MSRSCALRPAAMKPELVPNLTSRPVLGIWESPMRHDSVLARLRGQFGFVAGLAALRAALKA